MDWMQLKEGLIKPRGNLTSSTRKMVTNWDVESQQSVHLAVGSWQSRRWSCYSHFCLNWKLKGNIFTILLYMV